MILIRVACGLMLSLALVACAGIGFCAAAEAAEAPAHHGAAPASDAATAAGQSGGAHGEGDTNPLDFKSDLALWTAVVFLLLLAVLWKFAWGPIAGALQRREQGIADQIAQAEQANQQAQQVLNQYEEKLDGARQEVRGMLEQSRRDAERAGRELLEKAKQQAEAEQQRALEQIDAAAADAAKQLAAKSATLAVELAGKIVDAELSAADHDRLIERAVADFVHAAPGARRSP